MSKIDRLLKSGDKSLIMRRSGYGIGLIAEFLQFEPEVVYQVGVGQNCEEVKVMQALWNPEFFGCEPHPAIFKSIKDSYPGTLSQVALSNFEGTGSLFTRKRHKDGSSLFPHEGTIANGSDYETKINVRKLENFWPVKNKRCLLWLDCEGSELNALNGAGKFIDNIHMVNVELTSNPPGLNWCPPEDVHFKLVDLGFVLQYRHTTRAYSGQTDAVYVRKNLWDARFCTCPYTLRNHRND